MCSAVKVKWYYPSFVTLGLIQHFLLLWSTVSKNKNIIFL
jgi:hypothetical protein